MRIATRLFVRNVWLQAVLMAFAATLCAELLWSPSPATYAALEWAPYDTWMRLRAHPARPSHVLLVVRDHASEQQFGVGHWDRSIPARLITALHDAGSAAIGIDIPLDLPSPPNLGGAVSDALLIEAVKSAGTVAYPAFSSSAFDRDSGLPLVPSDAVTPGRSTIQPAIDNDRIVRRMPLYQHSGTGELPSLGFTLASMFWHLSPDQVAGRTGLVTLRDARGPEGTVSTVSIPLDPRGRLLLNYPGSHSQNFFSSVTFLELSQLIDRKDNERLSSLVEGKAVILLAQTRPQAERTLPSGEETSDFLIQAHGLHTLLAQDWIRELSSLQRLVVTFILCLCLAWVILRWADWKGLLLGLGGLGLYLAAALVLLSGAQWVMPFVIPVTATVIVLLSTSLLGQVVATRRVALLEQDMLAIQQDLVAVREALVYRETAVETLQEDLESARASISHSVSKEAASTRLALDLQQQIDDAQAQEDATRRRMEELERQLHDMQAASTAPLRSAMSNRRRSGGTASNGASSPGTPPFSPCFATSGKAPAPPSRC